MSKNKDGQVYCPKCLGFNVVYKLKTNSFVCNFCIEKWKEIKKVKPSLQKLLKRG